MFSLYSLKEESFSGVVLNNNLFFLKGEECFLPEKWGQLSSEPALVLLGEPGPLWAQRRLWGLVVFIYGFQVCTRVQAGMCVHYAHVSVHTCSCM